MNTNIFRFKISHNHKKRQHEPNGNWAESAISKIKLHAELCGRQKRADPHKIIQRQIQCNFLNAPISPPTELKNLRFAPTLQDV